MQRYADEPTVPAVMNPVVALCFGVIPALLLLPMSIMGLVLFDGWSRLYFLTGLVGTTGLIWALAGVEPRHSRLLIAMLTVGEIGMLPLVAGLVVSLAQDGVDPLAVIGLWPTLGPMIVGAYFIAGALRLERPRSTQ